LELKVTVDAMKVRFFGILVITGLTMAQPQDGRTARPEFAVVSIKPNHADCCTGSGIGRGGSHGTHVTLQGLIELAYRVPPFQVSGGPGWVRSDRFDVECKADDPKTDNDHLRLMLQSMLEERFGLKIHREMKESSVYELVTSKNGPKVKSSPDQSSQDDASPPKPGGGPNHGGFLVGKGILIGNAVRMAQFATVISPQLERMVVDKTKLAGRFDIELRWLPDAREIGQDTTQGSPDLPSIFTAVQEQLGLKLESAKGRVEMIVIDRAEKPSAN
jgi:uncharacterized protein (TIGR03435 family)